MIVRAATRGSALARWQTDHVAALLRAAEPSVEVEVVVVDTAGDRRADTPIWEMGGKGVFVKEVQAAVLDGRADLAVHSAKDLPAAVDAAGAIPELVLAAVPTRADPRDALVGCTLDELPTAGCVATGSVRRRAQLAYLRPDLTFSGLRGNIDTRLRKAASFDAIVVAAAALDRLGEDGRIAQRLAPSVLLPQVAQGALAVEARRDDTALLALLARIEDGPSRRAVDAERSFLAALGGDCNLPAGALATVAGDGSVRVDALLATLDGHIVLRHRVEDADGTAAGRAAADHLRSLLVA